MVARPHGLVRPSGAPGGQPRARGGRLARNLAIAAATASACGLAVRTAQAKRMEHYQRGSVRRRVTMDEALSNMKKRADALFSVLDTNSNGYLDILELQEWGKSQPGSSGFGAGTRLLREARAYGIPVEFLATVLEQGDSDGDGFISREEFLEWMNESEQCLKQAFDNMDIDKSGLLSKTEVELAMRNLELPCGGGVVKQVIPSSAQKLIEEMGVSDTHEVDYEEFRYSVVTLARKDLSTTSSYWSKCYVAGPHGNSSLDSNAGRSSNVTGHIVAGTFAGFIAKTITSPLEVVLRMIITGRVPPGSSMGRVFKLIMRDEGVRGLYKGNLVNVIKTPPSRFFELGCLSALRDAFANPDAVNTSYESSVASPVVSAIAGALATILVFPLDTISVRLSVTKNVYRDLPDAFRRIIALETPSALFAGVVPTLLWTFPYMSIQYTIMTRLERRYRNIQREALRRNRKPPDVNEQVRLLVHGTIASTVAACICMPFETVRRRMQVQTIGGRQKTFATLVGVMNAIVVKEGWGSLYVGVEVLAMKTTLYSAMSFAAYEIARSILQPIIDKPKQEEMQTCAICT